MALQEPVRDVLSVNVSLCYKRGVGGGQREERRKGEQRKRKRKERGKVSNVNEHRLLKSRVTETSSCGGMLCTDSQRLWPPS